jgi:ATP-dependent exoDNAse (exonuclease V) alpha subunit
MAYAITVHKSQGDTYNEPYVIHEWYKGMNLKWWRKWQYVAVSRATKKDLIKICVV